MIFKRPDAFIVKHIKLIHAIILFCMGYLLYKTSEIRSVYDIVTSLSNANGIIGENYSNTIYNPLMYLALFLALFLTVMIIVILIRKKKKFLFHLILAILLIAMLIYYILSGINVSAMQQANVARTVRYAYSDITNILLYVQSVFLFILLFKATGFNVKTFAFDDKVIDLDVDEVESEEIELNLEIDGNEIKTKRRRQLRYLKYSYLEKRWKINLIVVFSLAIVVTLIMIATKSNQPFYYALGNELRSTYYTLAVTDAYLTNTDYSGKKIGSNESFIILKFKLKKNVEQEYNFDSGYIGVVVNDKTYYSNPKYLEYFADFGVAYKEQKLTQEYQDYYLAYQIPYEFSTKEIYIKVSDVFDYTTNRYNYYEIKTTYERLTEKEEVKEFNLTDEMNVEAYGIKNKVTIDNVNFDRIFKINSNAQINDKNYNLVEYITPTAEDNETKGIMRIIYGEKVNERDITNFSTILLKYAIIEYDMDDTKKEGKFYSFIAPQLSKESNVYYVQVSEEVLKGQNRTIKIKIRNQVFKYKLD